MKYLLLMALVFISSSADAQTYYKPTKIELNKYFGVPTKPVIYIPIVTDTISKTYQDRQIIVFNHRLYIRDSIRSKWLEVKSAHTGG